MDFLFVGLPIVVKQEQSSSLAAGQYDIHEQARSLQPLLFSYANREAPYLCTMRLGKNVQIEDYFSDGVSQLRGTPSFCERFSTDGGSCTRNLKLVSYLICTFFAGKYCAVYKGVTGFFCFFFFHNEFIWFNFVVILFLVFF